MTKRVNGVDIEMENRNVVPYNAWLCKKYNAHINVEFCASVRAVKYLFKYVYKGHDRLQVQLQPALGADGVAVPVPVNEIDKFTDGRYVGTCEAFWRLYHFSLHEEFPHVVRLALHLEDQQGVVFGEDANLAEIAANAPKTTLTQWMAHNRSYPTESPDVTYSDFPAKHTWDVAKKRWAKRKTSATAIGRMYFCSPRDGEKYYLRLLLNHVPGAKSYADLRTVYRSIDGVRTAVIFPTFKDAARDLGLLEDDDEWDRCLEEAAAEKMPVQLCELFSSILIFNSPADTLALWEKHKLSCTDDILHAARVVARNPNLPPTQEMFDQALRRIQAYLLPHGKTLADFPNMPIPPPAPQVEGAPAAFLAEHYRYDRPSLSLRVARDIPLLIPSQRLVFDQLMAAVNNPTVMMGRLSNAFFLESPGGCGKTFIFNLLLAALRAEGKIALGIASSGIAALLLEGGSTAHSRLKIPINLTKDSTANLRMPCDAGKLLQMAALIIWDEAPMAHKHAHEVVDKLLRDLMGQIDPLLKNVPFGGKVVLFGGDFRQVLPVVPRGTKDQIVRSALNYSDLWGSITKLKLTVNMRVQRAVGADAAVLQDWADKLLLVGEGRAGNPMLIPAGMACTTENPAHLIHDIFGDLSDVEGSRNLLITRAILTPKNDGVDMLNEMATASFPGEARVYLSADTIHGDEQAGLYPTEFLNTLQPQGMPAHMLSLKIGAPIMLLRNLNPSIGLANGTRLIVRALSPHVIQAEIVTGAFIGRNVLIPRIPLMPSDNDMLPFKFTRRQFPVRAAFAMTINKSQGQTFDMVGVYLPAPCFSHGQLYVAMSRVGNPSGIKIMAIKTPAEIAAQQVGHVTQNVVFCDVFLR